MPDLGGSRPSVHDGRGGIFIGRRQLVKALLYALGKGCKWRSLPAHFSFDTLVLAMDWEKQPHLRNLAILTSKKGARF